MPLVTPFLVLLSIMGTIADPTCPKDATLRCCQVTVAGDLAAIQYLATLTNYELSPKDVSCVAREYMIPQLGNKLPELIDASWDSSVVAIQDLPWRLRLLQAPRGMCKPPLLISQLTIPESNRGLVLREVILKSCGAVGVGVHAEPYASARKLYITSLLHSS